MRYKCSNPRCRSSKPARKMSQVFRSRQDPTPIGLVCSGGCARVVIAADAKDAATRPPPLMATRSTTPRSRWGRWPLVLVAAIAVVMLSVVLR